jgi:hypothetical protein
VVLVWYDKSMAGVPQGDGIRCGGACSGERVPLKVPRRFSGQALRQFDCTHRKQRSGQATLSFILLVGGIVLEVAIAGSFATYFLSSSGLGERLSARAFTTAEAGIRDAQMRITRNKEFAQSGPVSYSIGVGIDGVSVDVSRSTLDSTNYVFTATSTGTAVSRSRRLVAVLVVNRETGLVQLQSLAEVSF